MSLLLLVIHLIEHYHRQEGHVCRRAHDLVSSALEHALGEPRLSD
jgi:hypothetical protein